MEAIDLEKQAINTYIPLVWSQSWYALCCSDPFHRPQRVNWPKWTSVSQNRGIRHICFLFLSQRISTHCKIKCLHSFRTERSFHASLSSPLFLRSSLNLLHVHIYVGKCNVWIGRWSQPQHSCLWDQFCSFCSHKNWVYYKQRVPDLHIIFLQTNTSWKKLPHFWC